MAKFNNRENERVVLPDGRIIFIARSTAVVGCVLCVNDDKLSVLMVERGPKVDNSGKWCMPCGYLDWDESLKEAVIRELFEETGLDFDALDKSKVLYAELDNPYRVQSSPKSHRQNVSHHFGIVIQGPPPELPKTKAMQEGEVASVEWVPLDAIPTKENLESSGLKDYFAFNHNEDIHVFVDFWKKREALAIN